MPSLSTSASTVGTESAAGPGAVRGALEAVEAARERPRRGGCVRRRRRRRRAWGAEEEQVVEVPALRIEQAGVDGRRRGRLQRQDVIGEQPLQVQWGTA